jgi:hypothetical protein
VKYLPQSKLATWRKENKPKKCALLGIVIRDPVVDHDHNSGMVRGVVSREGNSLLGRIENAYKRLSVAARALPLPWVLRAMADYLERPDTDILHPVGLTQLCKRFKNGLTAKEQEDTLYVMKADPNDIRACTNSKKRTHLYRKLLKDGKYFKH